VYTGQAGVWFHRVGSAVAATHRELLQLLAFTKWAEIKSGEVCERAWRESPAV
jgi:hypothetical protein